jgi:AbrB family looped-hinge helix DNA binding protein
MKINSKGQITIPKQLLEMCGLTPGDEVEFIPLENGVRVQKRVTGVHPVQRLRGVIKLEHGETVDKYIDEIRGPADLPEV